jgi:hypothetical protein
MKLTVENRSTRKKNLSQSTLSTTNPTWTDPGLRGERPATNNLSHGTALIPGLFILSTFLVLFSFLSVCIYFIRKCLS